MLQFSKAEQARQSELDYIIDHGPLLDRLGPSVKLALLASTHPTIRAVITDFQSRKWLDLRRPDLRLGFELLLPLNPHPDFTQELIDKALTPPATLAENSASRALYFS